MTLTLKELGAAIEAEPVGDPNLQLHSVNTLEDAGDGQVSFLSNPKYMKKLWTTKASAVIVAPAIDSDRVALLRSKDPYYSFTRALVCLHGYRKHPHAGIHPRAAVDPAATVGEGSILYPGVYVGPRARIGRDCILYPNVVVYDDCVLGDRVTIHANTTIGSDGFGYATHNGEHHKIPQIGNVVIEDNVEIGANCGIDRAAMGSTVIGKGTKISDLVTFGHNSRIGPHGLLVGGVAVAGSVTIGHHVTMAGQVGVAGHLRIGDNVTVGAQSGVMMSIDDQSTVVGSPAMPVVHARRVYSLFTQLPKIVDRVKKLEEQVAELGMEEGPPEDGAPANEKGTEAPED